MDWLTYNKKTNSWHDSRDDITFSIMTKWRTPFVEKGHVKSKDWKNFHYLSPEEWAKHGAIRWFRQHFGYNQCLRYFEKLNINGELLLSTNQDLSQFKDKKVLVVSGGPSSSEINPSEMTGYDYKFTCNHFFKNEQLLNTAFDLILLGQEVNLKDKTLVDYVKKHNPFVGFEQSDARRPPEHVVNFALDNNARAFLYLTRYFSKLGFGPRLVVLAVLLGCKEVHFAGIDGWKDPNRHDHAFENNKPPPVFNHLLSFQRQMAIFWQYVFTLCGDTQTVLNLTESSDFNAYEGIRGKVYEELNK